MSGSLKRTGVPEFRLVICIPSRDTWITQFGMSLVGLVRYLTERPIDGYRTTVAVDNFQTHNICYSRTVLLDAAVQQHRGTHALFLDSDMKFPADTVHRLARHRKEIVGVNCPMRRFPITSTAIVRRDEKVERIAPTQDVGGLAEVEACGTGVMLIDLRILQKIEKPWFVFLDAALGGGEDHFFCLKAREAGYPTYIDLDLSKEIGHVGQFEYRLDSDLSRLTPSGPCV